MVGVDRCSCTSGRALLLFKEARHSSLAKLQGLAARNVTHKPNKAIEIFQQSHDRLTIHGFLLQSYNENQWFGFPTISTQSIACEVQPFSGAGHMFLSLRFQAL